MKKGEQQKMGDTGVEMKEVGDAGVVYQTQKKTRAAKPSCPVVCVKQTKLLMTKNFLLQRRNVPATTSQLFVGLLFILLMIVMKEAILGAYRRGVPSFTEVRDPLTLPLKLPQCDPAFAHPNKDLFPNEPDNKGCYSFLVAGTSTTRAEDVQIGNHIADVLGFPGENSTGGFRFVETDKLNMQVRTFANDLREWLLDNPNVTRLALIMGGMSGGSWSNGDTVDYTIVYNSTQVCSNGQFFGCVAPANETAAFQTAVDSAIIRHFNDSAKVGKSAKLTASFREMPHPASGQNYDVVAEYAPSMFLIVLSFNFIVQMWTMVDEKERKLPSMLRQMGMLDSAYWGSWILNHLITNTIMVLIITGASSLANFQQFMITDYSIVFFTFWLSALGFTGMAIFLSSIFRTADTASSAGLAMLIFWFIGLPIGANLLYGTAEPYLAPWQMMFAWLPVLNSPMQYYVMITRMVQAGTGPTATGMRWEDRKENILARYIDSEGVVSTSFWSYEMSMVYQITSFILHVILAMYLEKIVPNSYGKRGSVCCCITRFIKGKSKNKSNDSRSLINVESIKKYTDDVDVTAEAALVKSNWNGSQRAIAMEVIGLTKTFHKGQLRAVDGIAYGVNKDSLFVLLGHNGAGKTTTINMLVGNMNHNGGDALVFGNSISDDMSTVNQIMGVCPQHDVLYHRLTGAEHLRLFATMKSSSGAVVGLDVEKEVSQRLMDVNLMASQNVSAGAYSGGMQRRLSIAIALIGNPKIVYLDEPTTGMDPVTRRSVWDMIQRAKQGRVIMLTTHSMEEADILGDRVAVMSHGHIQALGSPLELKRKFGVGFSMTVFLDAKKPTAAEDTIAFFKQEFPSIQINKHVDQAIKFKVPIADDDPKLVPFFKTLEENKDRCGIKDFSVGLATLEEVFLELSRRDQMSADDFFHVQFTIPEGAVPGTQLAVPLPDGSAHTMTVSENQKPGDQLDLRVPKPKKSSDDKVDVGDKAEASAKSGNRSFGNTCKALTQKTWTLTRRKYGVLCGNICFPVVILLLIILLNSVLDGFRYSAICGKDIKDKETCRKKGYNMTCITGISEQAAPPSGMDLLLGQPYRGWGIDKNCGDDSGGVYDESGNGNNGTLCYDKLEKPAYKLEYSAEKKSSSPNKDFADDLGSISYSPSDDLKTWYNNFRFELTSSYCDEIVESMLDCDDQCEAAAASSGRGRGGVARGAKIDRGAKIRENYVEAGFDYGFDTSDTDKCNDQCQNLTLANSYRGRDDGEPLSDDFFASCLKDDESTTGNNPNFWTPLNETRDVVENIYTLKASCELAWVHNVSRWFATKDVNNPTKGTGNFDFVTSVTEASASKSSSGYLGSFTTQSVMDDGFGQFWASFMKETGIERLLQNHSNPMQKVKYMMLDLTYMSNKGMGKMADTCKIILNPPYNTPHSLETLANERIQAANMTMNIKQLCEYVWNIDAVRNVRFTEADTVKKLHDNLFNRHTDYSSGEVSTPYMKSREKYHIGYKQHYYTSDVLAFEFDHVDMVTGESSYSAYWNFSGTSSQPFPVIRARGSHWNHLILMADSMFVSTLTGGSKRIGGVRTQTFPQKFDCNAEEFIYDDTGTVKLDCFPLLRFLNYNLADYIAGIMMMFFFWAPIYGIVQGIVYEKQYRLRVIMRMMGLTSNVYWLVTYVLEVLKYVVTLTVVFVVGRMLGLAYFSNHNQVILWFFMFVWANLIVVFGFFLAALFKSTKTSGAVTFLILMMFLTSGQDLTIFTYNFGGQAEDFAILMWNPCYVMFRWAYAFAFGGFQNNWVTAENVWTYQNGTLAESMGLMILHWFIWALLAAYLNQVLSTGGHGAREPFYFCLTPKWWKSCMENLTKPKLKLQVDNLGSDDVLPDILRKQQWYRPKDAEAEHKRVVNTALGSTEAGAPNIRVINLHKQFPSAGGAPPKVAVRCISMGVNVGECFGLLGHNGAGKTTAINMLTGLFAPTSGNAYVGRYSIRDNISAIYADMGVCPQHDLLWPALTAEEHLRFYGRLKGFTGTSLKEMIKEMLKKVNLTGFAKRRAGGFSGGMKRRLSMANALMGGPSIVYMDEPSTGLDPASKHGLWDVISSAKKMGKRSMVLTTHSMEEADVLCDRLCIMADGEVQCIGQTHELKRRFGRGCKSNNWFS